MTNTKSMFRIMLLVLGSVLLGCVSTHDDASRAQASRFSITPGKIKINQNFMITLPKAHPANMSIRDPRGEWYWVQYASENIKFMPDAEFKRATKITITPAHLKGTTWIEGKRVDALVFKYAGEYLIYFANNLETEPENTFYLMGTVTVKK
jgi:hypothetical protein